MPTLELDSELVTHHVSVSFKHLKGSLGKASGIDNWHILKLRVLLPVLVEDKQQFLGTTESKARHKTLPTSSDDVVNHLLELGFSHVTIFVLFDSVSTLYNEHINLDVLGDLCRFQVPVLFS